MTAKHKRDIRRKIMRALYQLVDAPLQSTVDAAKKSEMIKFTTFK